MVLNPDAEGWYTTAEGRYKAQPVLEITLRRLRSESWPRW